MRSSSFTVCVAVAAFACLPFTASAAPQIVPPDPVALERVHLRLTIDDCVFNKDTVGVELRERTLRVHHRPRQCLVPDASEVIDVLLGTWSFQRVCRRRSPCPGTQVLGFAY